MALIKCPECGREVSDLAKACPGCGYAINKQNKKLSGINEQNKMRMIISIVVIVVIVVIIVIASSNIKKKNDYNRINSYSDRSDYSYSSSATSKNDYSTIFRNLDIRDFSCSSEKHSGTMQCKVTNNYNYTVGGYFRVNFYDSSGKLLYNQLMSLPDVAPGETVVCSTAIPKDNYPYDYATVDFSQASLTTKD